MSLKASALKSNDSQRKALTKEITSILGRIDDELKVAHEQGRHEVSAALPIIFSIPYMANKDAQRIIYYKVLTNLKDREFNVSIELKQNSTVFHITWLSSEEKNELDLQNTILAKHTKSRLE